jgi:hypothetical protein
VPLLTLDASSDARDNWDVRRSPMVLVFLLTLATVAAQIPSPPLQALRPQEE